jgi:hypothetical protein
MILNAWWRQCTIVQFPVRFIVKFTAIEPDGRPDVEFSVSGPQLVPGIQQYGKATERIADVC